MASKERIVIALFIYVVATVLSISASRAQERVSGSANEILSIHKSLLAAHLENNAEGVLAAEADTIIVVSRGEVLLVSRRDRKQQFVAYLDRSKFEQYRDINPPIISVSEDGTMGWLIAQVQIVGVEVNDNGEHAPIESTWAWIELYEKREGRWVRVGEVSNTKPPYATRKN